MAAVAGSSWRATTSSSSSANVGVGVELLLQAAAQAEGADRDDLAAQVALAALGQRALLLDVARGARRASRPARRRPRPRAASVLTIGTRQPRWGASDRTPRISRTIVSVSGWSALLTTMMSGISMTPAFSAWIESPEPGIRTKHDGVGVVDDVDLGLADADGLQEDVVLAGGVHQQRGLQRGLAEAAERAAVGHRADEDAGVEEVVGQPDAVAEQRAVRERRGRVDRQHGDLAVLLAAQLGQRADQRRLARARARRSARRSTAWPVCG